MPHCIHARHLLREHGYRVTPQRLMVLEVIRTADHHLTAEEIHSAMQERYPGVDLSTVYRALRLFVRLGLVEQRELGGGRRVYEWRTHPDHGHFLCERCGRLEHLEGALLEPLRLALERAHGYQVHRVEATVLGVCPACRNAS
ncbi:Fur family transcriptional regulator [Thermoflexus sp.]|uniref:Fur family transcriptional regulator n=1 Tax=Thermoflexus sp. TaxID=1969742 RepID=UPI0025D5A4E8|nr:Fur family transcriptional regulator [Thermoflexus sp.]MDW8180150.1 Fur family transcriptional regulator [Anaerolineae bacterium]MCS6963073.1 transcriptional repressor [Thermoflexus sp.]MCS7350699.1 transcriptional repressor [Thermoflexus sp.]MCX7690608.1 transcriptional repressor [Thermoflexus sp.]MDW8184522.1 Fur family transcriptional regulator [Anaerolineae bacterium]